MSHYFISLEHLSHILFILLNTTPSNWLYPIRVGTTFAVMNEKLVFWQLHITT